MSAFLNNINTAQHLAHSPDPAEAFEVPRLLGDLRGNSQTQGHGSGPCPTLVCVAGLHGNERSGVLALQRILATLGEDDSGLVGRLVGFSGNRAALRQDVRHIAEDMNRVWRPENIESVCASDPAELSPEALELRELHAELSRVLPQADCLLDLHSTSGPGSPFVVMDDTLRNRAFAGRLPVPRVLGLEEELAGTLTGYVISKYPIPAIAFEGGQHQEPSSVEHAAAAIWIAMETAGILARDSRPEPRQARALLAQVNGGIASVVEVRHRHEVRPEAEFQMEPGFSSFQRISRGDLLALDRQGPVTAPVSALMLMPRYQGLGSDGFFLVRPVHPIWLAASAWLRQLQAMRWVHLLPGVRRHPSRQGSFLVDRQRARWFVRQIFHLLGFRREPETGPETVLTPRDSSRAVRWD